VPRSLVAVAATLIAALVLTPLVRAFARRRGFVARPVADRWHKQPTAMLGGVAIFVATVIGIAAAGLLRGVAVPLIASSLLFVAGLLDDFLHLKPYQKLVVQIAAAILVINFGLMLPWTPLPAANIALTIFWLVGITNAVNMLDNMDGLAGGIAVIASFFLAVVCVQNGQTVEAAALFCFAAAVAGFLVYNFNPASIFMGDCGSMFIGFMLGSLALASSNVLAGGRSRSLLAILAVPVLILFIPIFDTTFVTVMRKLFGRRASQGGRDHTSHRLVALGISERKAVLLLYAMATVSGAIALLSRRMEADLGLGLIIAFAIIMAIVGLYLAGVTVYKEAGEAERAARQPIVAFLIDLSYKRRVFEVLLDVVLIIGAYALAYRLHFGPPDTGLDWQQFRATLPLIIGTKMVVFLVLGAYRGLWRYISFDDIVVLVRAVAGGSVLSIVILLFTSRFAGLSRVVFVLDGLFLLVFVLATRTSFRLFRSLLRPSARRERHGPRVLIFGAGDAGELLLRELRNNEASDRHVVAFFDDDARKIGKVLHGLPVTGNDLDGVIEAQRIDEVIVSPSRVAADRLEQIARVCEARTVRLNRLNIAITPVSERPEPA
jgi:UDP-GlcNAc:undecaprenyl-phosphate GlcNAc-1-phosphate transferase